MCIHGDKSQPERDWVLNGESELNLWRKSFSLLTRSFEKPSNSKDFLYLVLEDSMLSIETALLWLKLR